MTDRAPGLDRRDFLRMGILAAPATLAACGWDGGPLLEPKLRAFGRINDWVGERILLSPTRLVAQYPASARTAPGDFPSYSITRNRTGRFPVLKDLETWRLRVEGLVRKPVSLSRADLERLPSVTYTVKHYCVEGWTAVATWTGVPVSTIIAMVEPTNRARYLRFDSFDSDYYNGWDLRSALHPQTILAYAWNGRPLQPNHGAPLRLYSPIKIGYKMTKYLTAMTFTRDRPGGYWEDRGYPWFAGV